MQTYKVIDPKNVGFQFIASKVSHNDIILTMNFFSKYRMQKVLLKYGKRNITVDNIYKYFASKLKRSYVGFYKLTEIIYKQNKYKHLSNIDRRYIISRLAKMYFTQKSHMIENDEDFYNKFNFFDYIPIEEYKKFKQYIKDVNISDCFDLLNYAFEINFNKSFDNIYILHSEDISPLVLKAINKCFTCNKLYFIGDEYKVRSLYSNGSFCEVENEIDLSSLASIPVEFLKTYEKIKKEININYNFQFIQNGSTIVVIDNFLDAILNAKNQQGSVAILYDYPLFASIIEPLLFKENIPFVGIMKEYKFPKNLYQIYKTIRSIIDRSDAVTHDELKNLFKSIKGEIIDRFGGVKNLLKKYNLPVYAPSLLRNTSLFVYLMKAWFDRKFASLLKSEYYYEWNKWLHKFSEKWIAPDVICNTVVGTKGLEFDTTIYIRNNIKHDYSLYTVLMMTNKKLILTKY